LNLTNDYFADFFGVVVVLLQHAGELIVAAECADVGEQLEQKLYEFVKNGHDFIHNVSPYQLFSNVIYCAVDITDALFNFTNVVISDFKFAIARPKGDDLLHKSEKTVKIAHNFVKHKSCLLQKNIIINLIFYILAHSL